MAGTSLEDILQQFALDKYYDAFISVGIDDIDSLVALTMQDYPALGITSMQDRRKMFHLIQNIKDKDTNAPTRNISEGQQPSRRMGKDPEMTSRNENYQSTPECTRPRIFHRENTTHEFSYGIPSSKMKPKTPSKAKSTSENSKIKVCVRKRPLSNEDIDTGETDIVDAIPNKKMVAISAPKVAVDLTKYMQKFSFAFDEVFDESITNHQVYEKTCKPLVNEIFTKGIKATCFAYGCTGSGKTYTMLGTDNIPGLYLLAASDIFSILYSGNHGNGLGLWVSFYEIYCGQLFDLLNDRSKLFARENAAHQVCIVGLTEKHVKNVEELMEVIESGGNSRSTGSTGVNADSSRSHAILQLDLKTSECGETLGRFSFIDLAGSERAADVTDSDKQTRMEGAEINQSLLALPRNLVSCRANKDHQNFDWFEYAIVDFNDFWQLKECIRALDQDSRHTPFRQSKLTQVLKDSFVGNTKTCMIANISPCSSSSENTLNTLRYSDRVKELNKNEAVMNISPRPGTVHGQCKDSQNQNYSPRNTTSSSSVKMKDLQKLSNPSPDQLNLVPNNRLDINNMQMGNFMTKRPKTSNTTPKINTKNKKGRNGLTFRSLEPSSSRTARYTLDKTRPDTSPADIHGTNQINKSKSTRKLQYAGKEQSHNTLKTKHSPTLEKRFELDIKEEKPKRQMKSRVLEHRNNRISQSCISEEALADEIESTQTLVSQKLDTLRTDISPQLLSSSPHHEENVKQSVTSSKSKTCCHDRKPVENILILESNKSNGTATPLSNNRYSKGIKARLAQLFNSKSTTSLEILPDHKQLNTTSSSVRSKRALQPIQQVTPRVITEEQIIAAHHTQLAMVTGLCHEEMILLKEQDKNKQDFKEYAVQLEEILLQKQACIENLQEKLKKWKSTMQ